MPELDALLSLSQRKLGVMQPRPASTLHVGGDATIDSNLSLPSGYLTLGGSGVHGSGGDLIADGALIAGNGYLFIGSQKDWYFQRNGVSNGLFFGSIALTGNLTRSNEIWNNPGLLNSWAQYSVGVWDASFRKMPDGRVIMRGLLTGGALGTTAFILPAGYRPSRSQMFACVNAGGVVRADVTPAGVVVPANTLIAGAYSNAYTSLSEISFFAEL